MLKIEKRLNSANSKYWAVVEDGIVKHFSLKLDRINHILGNYDTLLKERNTLETQNKVLFNINQGLRDELAKHRV